MIRRLSFLAFSVLFIFTSVTPALGGGLKRDLSEVRQRMSALRSQIEDSGAERSDLADQVLETQGRLETAELGVVGATAKVDRIDRELVEREQALDAVRVELAELFTQLAESRASRDAAREEAESWAVEAYTGGGAAQPSIAFSAADIVDISVGIAYLDVLTRYSSSAAARYAAAVVAEERKEAEVESLEASIASDVDALEGTKADAVALSRELERKRAELADEVAVQSALLDEVEAAVAEFEGELAVLARDEASIRRKIAAAEAAAAAASEAAQATRPGKLVRPIPGRIESGFGLRVHPITGKTRMHNGLDMHGRSGDPIKAAADGTVILAGVKGGYGNTVMIDHGGGMVTLYAHQSKLRVKVGQKVEAGEVIGWVGSTGLSTGPHLHFEVRINGSPVDAAKYL